MLLEANCLSIFFQTIDVFILTMIYDRIASLFHLFLTLGMVYGKKKKTEKLTSGTPVTFLYISVPKQSQKPSALMDIY
jgi:hypothetical protein